MKTNYFAGKKVTLMGLGLLGRGVGDAKFLAEHGADLIVTDLKTEGELKPSLEKLKEHKNISYTLGEHKIEDFRDRDMILKGADVPTDSPYVAEARTQGIPIEMSTALLVRLLRKSGISVEIIGVTGTRGKTTVTQLIYDIARADGRRVHLGGNIKGFATLPLLDVVQQGDTLVLELDSWQLQGFAEHKMSPHIAVFTNFYPDHQDYYGSMNDYWNDKAAIYRYQRENDILIAGPSIENRITDHKGKLVVASKKNVPEEWNIQIPGDHNRENIALATAASKAVGIGESIAREAVESFKGVHGRLELLKEVNGIKIYNDNISTTPVATLAAIRALSDSVHLILIIGGVDKGVDMSKLLSEISKHCKAVVLFIETGTQKIKDAVYNLDGLEVVEANTPKEIIEKAFAIAQEGDTILFSPAFASFGKYYKNVYDRGEQFLKNVAAFE